MRRRGFAYLEILLATALFVSFAVPLYSWFASLDRILVRTDHSQIAKAYLEKTLEEQRGQTTLTASTQTLPVAELPSGQVQIIITDADPLRPRLWRVDVTVSWQEAGQTREIQAATLINRGEQG